MARIDFMLVNNVPFVIEVNTIPGFSAESIVPKMIKESGNSIADVWAQILSAEVA
jgi:D-alanine-D-alanine ligase